jgi:hypothetical protein
MKQAKSAYQLESAVDNQGKRNMSEFVGRRSKLVLMIMRMMMMMMIMIMMMTMIASMKHG